MFAMVPGKLNWLPEVFGRLLACRIKFYWPRKKKCNIHIDAHFLIFSELRSRTAGVSFRSILDAIVKHYLNDQEIKKSHFFWDPPKSFLTSQNAVFFGTLKID